MHKNIYIIKKSLGLPPSFELVNDPPETGGFCCENRHHSFVSIKILETGRPNKPDTCNSTDVDNTNSGKTNEDK